MHDRNQVQYTKLSTSVFLGKKSFHVWIQSSAEILHKHDIFLHKHIITRLLHTQHKIIAHTTHCFKHKSQVLYTHHKVFSHTSQDIALKSQVFVHTSHVFAHITPFYISITNFAHTSHVLAHTSNVSEDSRTHIIRLSNIAFSNVHIAHWVMSL